MHWSENVFFSSIFSLILCQAYWGIIYAVKSNLFRALLWSLTHSSTLAWKIPWVEEPGRPQSMGLRRVGHDWATSLSLFTLMHLRRKWQPTPVFLPGESQGRGEPGGLPSYGVTQSWTRLKRLSSSSSRIKRQSTMNPEKLYRAECSLFQSMTINAIDRDETVIAIPVH